MGESIIEMSYDGIKDRIENIKNDKLISYAKVMSYACTEDEAILKAKEKSSELTKTLEDYIKLRPTFEGKEKPKVDEHLMSVYKELENRYNETRSTLESIMDNDKELLKFFVKSNNVEEESNGVFFKDENGNKLYEGINDALCNGVLSIVSFSRDKERGYQEDLEDDKPLKQAGAKDEIVMFLQDKRLPNIDAYGHFFRGDGYGFHKKMIEIMKDEDTLLNFNKYVDESVLEDKNDSYKDYIKICMESLNKDYSIKNTQTL